MQTIIGILLIIIGVGYYAFSGSTYTTQEKVLDVGPIEATANREHRVPFSPLLDGALIVGGILIIALGSRRGSTSS